MAQPTVIAIDGTAASGKSTAASILARRLGYLFFDTGVMYRAVTWAALEQEIPIEDEGAITALAQSLLIEVTPPTKDDGRQYTVYADETDITWDIRQPAVEESVSPISAYPGVRRALTKQQRRIAAKGHIIMVGRDIGTVVVPDADLKLYLKASVEERARRRYEECKERDPSTTYQQVLKAMKRRDQLDSERSLAPLRPADDAIIVDTDGLSLDQVVAKLESLVVQTDCKDDGAGEKKA